MDSTVAITVPQMFIAFIAAMGIPSALTGYLFRKHEKLEKRSARKKKRTRNAISSYCWTTSMRRSHWGKPQQGLYSVSRMLIATVICTQLWTMLNR